MPPPPDRRDRRVEVSRLVDQLPGAGGLAGDHPGVVVGMDDIGAGFLPHPVQRRLAGRV